jgi:uncharacterized Zn finger protein
MTIKIKCPSCGRDRNFLPQTTNKENWTAQCFFCGKGFKIYPKSKLSRIA